MKINDMKIKHLIHLHVLEIGSAQEPYQCNEYKEVGFIPCFKCEECNFNFHEGCAMLELSAFHTFFFKCNFKFCENALGFRARYFDACGKDVLGFVYPMLAREST
jgi:hypothetical protein